MNILGLYAIDFDPSACLLKDGKITAMAEEERFIRIKHATNYFPVNAIRFCLKQGGIELKDVDFIAIGWDVNAYLDKMPKFFSGLREKYKDIIDEGSIKWQENILKRFNPETYTNYIINKLKEMGYSRDEIPKIEFFDHHYSHALSAYHCSGFKDAIVLTTDGHGQENCTVLWKVQNGKFEKIKAMLIPHSLGWYYAAFTAFLGFRVYDGEGKTMGLAPYGKPNKKFREYINKILRLTEDGYEIDPSYICYGKKSYEKYYTDKFVGAFGEKSDGKSFTEEHKDITFEAQEQLEKVGAHLVNIMIKKTGIKNLCLAGGVALNCKMNGYIWKETDLENIFIQPISGDDGSALGAAIASHLKNGGKIEDFEKLEHVFLGPGYSNEEIEELLKKFNLNYKKTKDIEQETAKLLAEGKIVGWFQGRMEVGPRALGSRSILADPRKAEMKDLVNNRVKFRDSWRPFCPSLLYERASDYLIKPHESPFMILTFEIKDDKKNKVPAIVHVDGTARPQLVKKEVNFRYWKLIKEFENLTGEGVILNTSFNIKGEPIVCTPEEAINCFLKTGMDVLAIGDYLVKKIEIVGEVRI